MTKVYVYNRYDDEFIKEFDCADGEVEFKDGKCIHADDCNDTVNDPYVTDGFGHKYFDCFAERQEPTIKSDRIWCFEHQERCKAPDNKCKFVKDEFCKLYKKPIKSDNLRSDKDE